MRPDVSPYRLFINECVRAQVQSHLVDAACPFCAFNGGADVFVDVSQHAPPPQLIVPSYDLPHEEIVPAMRS